MQTASQVWSKAASQPVRWSAGRPVGQAGWPRLGGTLRVLLEGGVVPISWLVLAQLQQSSRDIP